MNEMLNIWGLCDGQIRHHEVSYQFGTIFTRPRLPCRFTRCEVATCHAELGGFLHVNIRVHDFVGSRARGLEGSQK